MKLPTDSPPKSRIARRMETDEYYIASHWTLIGRAFFRHRLAMIGLVVLSVFYFCAIFANFVSPYQPFERYPENAFNPPVRVRVYDTSTRTLHMPFVYRLDQELHPETLREIYTEDRTQRYPIRLLHRAWEYKALGLFPTNLHLFGVDEPGLVFLLGTDRLGRDMLSRVILGARVSLSIGLVGVAISFVLGCLIGGISGYFGGPVDMIVQRIMEFLGGIPTLPLWMLLSAAIPATWPPLRIYFGITVILSIIGWTGLARTVRGKLLQLRAEDYALAAKIAGASEMRIITKHLLPGFMSYLIVSLTLAVPGMILGETALSFLGIGLRAPVVSWGVMLQQAQNVRTVVVTSWMMLPAVAVILTVLSFSFVGDGLRDAADPYKS